MLGIDQRTLHARVWVLMGDIAQQATVAKQALYELANQVNTLGVGLMNALPGEKAGAPNPSIQYLIAMAEVLQVYARACDRLSQNTASEK